MSEFSTIALEHIFLMKYSVVKILIYSSQEQNELL
jgi:hypothetical protein